ncbi:MAG: YfhO family protein [Bacteroidota bacterium]
MLSNPILSRIWPHLAAVFLFLIVASIYFLPQLQGKVVNMGDITSHRGMANEVIQFRESTGETSWWTNSMFGGMPTYQIQSQQPSNMVQHVEKFFQLFFDRPIGYFVAAMISFYILMITMGVNPWMSMIGAIAFGFSTNTLILFEAGHLTKIRAISFLPMIAAGIIQAYRGKLLLGAAIFAIGMSINLYANHIQMTYYLFMTLAIYFVAALINANKQGDMATFAKATGILFITGLICVGSSASKLWTTYEYGNDTMRGKPILKKEDAGPAKSSSETDGLQWEYAMQWSNGWLDLPASLIPGVVGGSSGERLGKNSATYQSLAGRANLGNDFRASLYWGSLPSTSGPAYFGAGIFFLFILGLFLVKGPVKWWLGLGTLLTFLMSMGSNMETFNRLLFDYLPLLNKFRTPNSVLSVTSFLMPFLAILGMAAIIDKKRSNEEVMRALKIGGGILGATCLFFAFLGGSMFDFSSPVDARLAQYGYDMNAIIADRQSFMQKDALRSLVIIGICAGLIWAYVQNKVDKRMVLIGLGLVMILDIWMVDRRYINSNSFVSQSSQNSRFQPRPVDTQILQDKALSYRVHDLSINTFNSSSSSYFHKTIGGYHPAKLQRYQDIIERHISNGNPAVLNMLNMKYLITQDQQVQSNPAALGNAWFVSSIKTVNTPNEEIDALNNFNPGEEAVINTVDFPSFVSGFSPQKNGSITLTAYQPNKLTYKSNASSEQLAIFSEVWYGPNKGWQAYIDDQPVDHARANYILRALRVPAGEHTIVFEFQPTAFAVSEGVSLASSLLIILGGIGYLGFMGYQNVQSWANEAPAPKPAAPKPKVKKTVSKTRRKKKK